MRANPRRLRLSVRRRESIDDVEARTGRRHGRALSGVRLRGGRPEADRRLPVPQHAEQRRRRRAAAHGSRQQQLRGRHGRRSDAPRAEVRNERRARAHADDERHVGRALHDRDAVQALAGRRISAADRLPERPERHGRVHPRRTPQARRSDRQHPAEHLRTGRLLARRQQGEPARLRRRAARLQRHGAGRVRSGGRGKLAALLPRRRRVPERGVGRRRRANPDLRRGADGRTGRRARPPPAVGRERHHGVQFDRGRDPGQGDRNVHDPDRREPARQRREGSPLRHTPERLGPQGRAPLAEGNRGRPLRQPEPRRRQPRNDLHAAARLRLRRRARERRSNERALRRREWAEHVARIPEGSECQR